MLQKRLLNSTKHWNAILFLKINFSNNYFRDEEAGGSNPLTSTNLKLQFWSSPMISNLTFARPSLWLRATRDWGKSFWMVRPDHSVLTKTLSEDFLKSDTQKINSNKIKLFLISRMLMFFCYQGFIPKGYQEWMLNCWSVKISLTWYILNTQEPWWEFLSILTGWFNWSRTWIPSISDSFTIFKVIFLWMSIN